MVIQNIKIQTKPGVILDFREDDKLAFGVKFCAELQTQPKPID
jgi:hypothetical protein